MPAMKRVVQASIGLTIFGIALNLSQIELFVHRVVPILYQTAQFAKEGYEQFKDWKDQCRHPYVNNDGPHDLEVLMWDHIFGQELAIELVVKAISSHWQDKEPAKALVLSFHGGPGTGKTLTTTLIAQALFQQGDRSPFVRRFSSNSDFPDPDKSKEYQLKLKKAIEETVKLCSRSLFIFDEMDLAPPGVFDVLLQYIHHPGRILRGQNYKKAIFIFISNVGEQKIYDITFKAHYYNKKRTDLAFTDFEEQLSNEAINKEGQGLYRALVLQKVLVDFFVPYLPMEQKHVLKCIDEEIRRQGVKGVYPTEYPQIIDGLHFLPENKRIFAKSGCKSVRSRVSFFLEGVKNRRQFTEHGSTKVEL